MGVSDEAPGEGVFQILSLSGGGYLGLYTAAVLAALEDHTKTPISRHFSLMAGTSIGGILALALAADVEAKTIQQAFEDNGQEIFGNKPAPESFLAVAADFCSRLLRSKYRAGALRNTIEGIVGADTRIGDLRHPVIVPAVNLSLGAPQVFKTPHHESLKLDLNLKVVDVAMATSAAPTFFPLARVGDSLYTDGGLFANSPDIISLHEATHFFGAPENQVRLLSVGTTTAKFSIASTRQPEFGIWQWARGARLMTVTIASQQQNVDSMLGHRLGDRYLRLDEQQSKEQEKLLGLDVATDEVRETVRALAAGTFQSAINDELLNLILAHEAPEPTFFNLGNPA